MYKKILSLALVLLMLCSCVCLSVSAYDPLPEDELLKQAMREAYIEQWLKDYGTSVAEYFDGTLEYFYYLGEAGCHVFQAAALLGDPVEPTDVIGDYRFTAFMCMSYCDTNPSGTYAYKDGELMTLKEAYNKGLVDLDLLYEQTDKKYTMVKLSDEELLQNKCKDAFIKQYEIPEEEIEATEVLFAVQFKNYAVFGVHPYTVSDAECYQYLDGYWFWSGNIRGDEEENPTGIYTLDNYGNVQSLAETVSEGFIDLDEIFEDLSEECNMFLRGDADGDKRLTVKDATLVQKYLAKVPEGLSAVGNHEMGYCIMEADNPWEVDLFGDNADVTIKDATYIQKKVAKKMLWEDDRQPFEYSEIIVSVYNLDVPEYTLEDFPEYAFKSIEINRLESIKTVMITLELEEYGKDSVINAINSLKYREGTEFDSINPNWLYYSADD